jgi:hypothetical protein
MVVCANCHANVPATNKFCSSCGVTLVVAAPEAAAPVAVGETSAEAPPTAVGPPKTAGEAALAAPPTLGSTSGAATPVAAQAEPPVKLVENTCPSCATVNPPGQPFCGQCGTHLTPRAA